MRNLYMKIESKIPMMEDNARLTKINRLSAFLVDTHKYES